MTSLFPAKDSVSLRSAKGRRSQLIQDSLLDQLPITGKVSKSLCDVSLIYVQLLVILRVAKKNDKLQQISQRSLDSEQDLEN